MRDFAVIKDPQVAKLFACATRRGILHNLTWREMTPGQLARVFDKPVSSIVYHLDALGKAGLVELTKTAQRGNLVERFYTATARNFVISYTLSEGLIPGSEDMARWTMEVCRLAASRLEAFGYEVPERQLGSLTGLFESFAKMENMAYELVISRQRASTRIEQPSLKLLTRLLTYHELAKSPEFNELMDDLSDRLESWDKRSVPNEGVQGQSEKARAVMQGV